MPKDNSEIDAEAFESDLVVSEAIKPGLIDALSDYKVGAASIESLLARLLPRVRVEKEGQEKLRIAREEIRKRFLATISKVGCLYLTATKRGEMSRLLELCKINSLKANQPFTPLFRAICGDPIDVSSKKSRFLEYTFYTGQVPYPHVMQGIIEELGGGNVEKAISKARKILRSKTVRSKTAQPTAQKSVVVQREQEELPKFDIVMLDNVEDLIHEHGFVPATFDAKVCYDGRYRVTIADIELGPADLDCEHQAFLDQ